jgi:hypothetical protein
MGVYGELEQETDESYHLIIRIACKELESLGRGE